MENSNHPADKLAEVKEQIKKLKKMEMDLKTCLTEMPEADRMGFYYKAQINERSLKRLNRDLLTVEVDPEVLERCFIKQSTDFLTLSRV